MGPSHEGIDREPITSNRDRVQWLLSDTPTLAKVGSSHGDSSKYLEVYLSRYSFQVLQVLRLILALTLELLLVLELLHAVHKCSSPVNKCRPQMQGYRASGRSQLCTGSTVKLSFRTDGHLNVNPTESRL